MLNKSKGWFIITTENGLNYTSEMEKAIGQSRGVNYEEYDRSLEKKLKVEKQREKDYQNAKMISSGVELSRLK